MANTAPTVEDLIPTRQTLLQRLKERGDDQSWREFFDTYWRLIYNMAIWAGLSHAEAQDVVQETVLSVLNKMPGFTYDSAKGSFKAWLRQLTHWRIADQFRKRPPHLRKPRDEGTTLLERLPDETLALELEKHWDDEWQKNLTDRALECVKERISPRQFQIFQLYALREWPVAKVTSTLCVSRAQVYVARHRVSRLLKKEIERLRRQTI